MMTRFTTIASAVRLAASGVLIAILATAPRLATAHDGHSHDLAPAAPATAAPRAEAVSDELEVVAAAAAGRLLIYVDRFATNEPVTGASVEVIEGDQTTAATEINAGIYAIAGWTRPPGTVALTVAIDAGGISDLLPVNLEIPTPTDPAAAAVSPTVWVVVGQTATIAAVAVLLLLIYARSRRRYDFFLESGSRFSSTALLVSAQRPEAIETVRTLRIGPSLVADRLWAETGCAAAINDAAQHRRFGFPVERIVYASVLHRMFGTEPGHSVSDWIGDYQVLGMPELDERQVNIAMAWLGKDAGDAARARPGRTTKDVIEERLFAQRTDAEDGLDLVFFNTVPVTLEAKASGRAKMRGPQSQQVAVGVVIDANRRPICFELWPGGALDVESVLPAIDRLRARFDIRRVCLVADLRIADPATIDALEARGLHFILGMRDSAPGGLRARVLADDKPLDPVRVARPRGGFAELRVKEVKVASESSAHERFIVYGAPKDDQNDAAASDIAGQYVLRTNTDLAPGEVVLRYRQLLTVEETFRDAKTILDMQSVPRARDAVVRGHMFCSFLALLLRRELEERLARTGAAVTWRDVARDLNRLSEVEVQQDERRFLLRTRPQGCAAAVLDAVGVAAPIAVERRFDDGVATIEAQAFDDTPWDRVRSRALTLTELAVAQAAQNMKSLGEWVSRQK